MLERRSRGSSRLTLDRCCQSSEHVMHVGLSNCVLHSSLRPLVLHRCAIAPGVGKGDEASFVQGTRRPCPCRGVGVERRCMGGPMAQHGRRGMDYTVDCIFLFNLLARVWCALAMVCVIYSHHKVCDTRFDLLLLVSIVSTGASKSRCHICYFYAVS